MPRPLVGRERRRCDPARPRAGPGHTIVTILADYGNRYQSKLFNADFLRSKGLPVPAWLDRKEHAEPDFVEVETA